MKDEYIFKYKKEKIVCHNTCLSIQKYLSVPIVINNLPAIIQCHSWFVDNGTMVQLPRCSFKLTNRTKRYSRFSNSFREIEY